MLFRSVDPGLVGETLQAACAEDNSDTVYDRAGARKLIFAASPEFRNDVTQLGLLQVRSRGGALVQIRQLAEFETVRMPTRINHANRFPARTLSFDPAPGTSAEDAIKRAGSLWLAVGARHPGVQGREEGVASEYSRASTDTPALIALDRKSTRLNSSHIPLSRMPSSA